MPEEVDLACPLSDYARGLQPHVLLLYQRKISAVGIDPFLIQDDQLDTRYKMSLLAIAVLPLNYDQCTNTSIKTLCIIHCIKYYILYKS